MKKIYLMATLVIVLTGCTQQNISSPDELQNQTSENSEVSQVTEVNQNEMLTFKARGDVTFDYPLGWQILAMTEVDLSENYKTSYENIFDSEVSRMRTIDINFDRPHDIGPYDRTVDIAIRDLSFKNSATNKPPASAKEYIEIMENSWEIEGEVETYLSPQGVEFVVWEGQSPVYEADMVFYITRYAGGFVEISRMGSGHEEIKKALEPMVDSLRFER